MTTILRTAAADAYDAINAGWMTNDVRERRKAAADGVL